MSFAEKLLHWHETENNRQMPWKGEKDPYKIWLSEIILQQTRVEQGWRYYENFIKNFPQIQDLANAKDEKVFKLWEGLGYYNRCKNLLDTARFITHNLKGNFPDDYSKILSLKGIGPYTAAAICSFAYNQPFAVVDGNVFRVLSRIFGIETATDSTEGKKIFSQLAEKSLAKKEAAKYNQAIMDFGATICKPANPLCSSCVMKNDCFAFKEGKVNLLPIKEKILLKKIRHFSWFVLKVKDETFIHKRTADDIWQNLHEFYLVETEAQPNWNKKDIEELLQNQFSIKPLSIKISKELIQQLTHQKIKAVFIEAELNKKPGSLKNQTWLKLEQIRELAFPKLVKDFIGMK
ncbi:A/G-specific adenine glycosylase [Arachidicoccus soli]|uniref:Adenine DNA glycosylase n=1 Tax=Arachidicoccus soli TaxID=2341117 RepID=A0A386HLJ2_9BACT|nr:A/G-specific adenine glycosylase [Arachidicoccus soli]AYD46532.1 A/G-specific adenine glycosylase [Arachidicoccus soli]